MSIESDLNNATTVPDSPPSESQETPPYFDLYVTGGYDSDLSDTVLDALSAHRPNGYAVLTFNDLPRILGTDIASIIPVCYGLADSGSLLRLIVHNDHIVYAVNLELNSRVREIQSQTRAEWLQAHASGESA